MVEKEKRLIQHNFKTTETEAEIIKKKMKSLGITNTSAFLILLSTVPAADRALPFWIHCHMTGNVPV